MTSKLTIEAVKYVSSLWKKCNVPCPDVIFKDDLVQLPCCGQGLLYIRWLKVPFNLALNASSNGASTTLLGNLFQCLIILTLNTFFLISNLISGQNLPSFSLKTIISCPSHTSPA